MDADKKATISIVLGAISILYCLTGADLSLLLALVAVSLALSAKKDGELVKSKWGRILAGIALVIFIVVKLLVLFYFKT